MMLLPVIAAAQKSNQDYPQGYFRNPLDIPILLAGNFGECRGGHFHSGLDIKTEGVENKKVHAAADGYISRIKMDKGGFGHALYITHANGYTTLYAHLNDFAPAIQKYLRREQYEKKKWDVDLPLTPTQFPVKKGDLIAYSGNTGGSTAPHLHFEIRNSKTEHPLNPQLFGFAITDRVPPKPKEVYFYNRFIETWPGKASSSVYVGTPEWFAVSKKASAYKPAGEYSRGLAIRNDTISLPVFRQSENIGIGVNVDDYMDGSENTIAFYTARLFMDDSLRTEVTLDNIGYDETRYINAYVDYATRQRERKWVQCLFQLPGNMLDRLYSSTGSGKGRLFLGDGKVHNIRIELTDNNQNATAITFYVRPVEQISPDPVLGKLTCDIVAPRCVYRIDRDDVKFELDEKQFYDNVCFQFSVTENGNGLSDKFKLHDPQVPVHHYFDLELRPKPNTITGLLKNKVVMAYSDGKDEDGRMAALTESGRYKSKVRNLGTYWLEIDTLAPVIESMQRKNSNLAGAKQLAFTVKDNMTSVRSFSGYLDGKWVCFEQHGDDFFYRFDEHCPKGKHKLVFTAEDENGNAASTTLNFVR